MAAPLDVLVVLANGNMQAALRIAQQREAGEAGIDTTALDPALTAVASGRRYRVEAAVALADSGAMRVNRTVDVGVSTRDGLAWRTLQSDRYFLPTSR